MTGERPDDDPPGRRRSLEFPSDGNESERRDDDPWVTTPAIEAFPRLGDTGQATVPERINAAWGLVPLVVFLLFFVAFAVAPQEPTPEGEGDSGETLLGLILVGGVLLGYVAGSIAAFKGSRRGITWTLPLSAVFLLLALVAAFGFEGEGGSAAATAILGLAAIALHVVAVLLAKPKGNEPLENRIPFAG